jgi:hypothetical protein
MTTALRRPYVRLAFFLALGGCYDQPFVPGNEADDRVSITNDEFELGQRVTYPETDIPIDPGPPATAGPMGVPGFGSVGPSLAPGSIKLTLKAEAAPPMVSGQTLQATAVWQSSGNRAVVSYAVAGAPALGGVDLFQVLGSGEPRLRSSATFTDSDVFGVSMDDAYVYLAQASADPARPSPAVVERILIDANKLTLATSAQAQLGSFAATSAASTGTTLYATSGSNGSVYAVDPSDMSIVGEYALDHARWVALDPAGGRIVVAQGMPGRLSLFEEGAFPGGSMNLQATYSLPGADVAESKTTVEVHGGKAFVAAGPAGVQIVCLADGQVIGSVPRPDPAEVGLDPSVVVTNAVTVQDDLMFISNGEAGVYAAAGASSFDTDGCTPPSISVLGKLRFDDLQSVNHVAWLGDELYVAAGLGGIKIVRVQLGR